MVKRCCCVVMAVEYCSGYDFGYLLRVLTSLKLPDKEQQFFELLSVYFPKVYDVKYLMKSCKTLKGGLQEVADHLEVGVTVGSGLDFMYTNCSWREQVLNIRLAVTAT